MITVPITVSHRKVDHTVEIDLPEDLDEAIKVLGEAETYKLFVMQLKTKLAGKAWAKFESGATDSDQPKAGRAGWQQILASKR